MKLVTRAEWGATSTKLTDLKAGLVTVHWEGPDLFAPGADTWDHSKCAGVVKGFQRYHMQTNGWVDIAYNAVVCPHGYVFEGRGKGKRSAANGDYDSNSASYAVCFMGGKGDAFTAAAKNAINDAAEWLVGPQAGWRVHRDWVETECPGDEIAAWVRAGHARSGASPVPANPEVPAVSPSAFRYVDGTDWLFDGPSRIHLPLGSNEQLAFLDDLGVKQKGKVHKTVIDMLQLAVPRQS